MAKRRVALSPRSIFALVLVGFVLVTTGVIVRRVYGVSQQRTITALQKKRDALDGDRIRLEGAIRDASSRSRLQPIAEQQLNMHIPKPEQQVILTRPQAKVPSTNVRPPRAPNDTL